MSDSHFLTIPLSVVIFGKAVELATRVDFTVTYDEVVNQINFETETLTSESEFIVLTDVLEDLTIRSQLAEIIMDNEDNWDEHTEWWKNESCGKIANLDAATISTKR